MTLATDPEQSERLVRVEERVHHIAERLDGLIGPLSGRPSWPVAFILSFQSGCISALVAYIVAAGVHPT